MDEIKQQFAEILRYSQNFYNEPLNGIDSLFETWYQNKRDFIFHNFDGELTYNMGNVSFELDENAKTEKLQRFSDRVYDYYNNAPLSSWLSQITPQEFYNNLTTVEYTIPLYMFWPPRSKESDLHVPKNFKVVRAFKFFEEDEDKLKQLQNEASQIIQENIVSGDLCLSVHPLDFLSLSENVHNWRSCHALDGEYRTGNLSYMLDSATVICYLRADKLGILPHFPESIPWNSKKWRILLFFSSDRTFVFAGRQYPFASTAALDIISKKLLPLAKFGKWTSWYDTFIDNYKDERSNETFYFQRMIPVGNTLKPFKEIIHEPAIALHFNDLNRSSVYSPMWAYRRKDFDLWKTSTGCSSVNTQVNIGHECICPICGKYNIIYSNMMTCPDCAEEYDYDNDDYRECEICGNMTHIDEMHHLPLSNLMVCDNCYEMETVVCQECDVRDLPDTVKYRGGDSRCLCPACFEDSQRRLNPSDRIVF